MSVAEDSIAKAMSADLPMRPVADSFSSRDCLLGAIEGIAAQTNRRSISCRGRTLLVIDPLRHCYWMPTRALTESDWLLNPAGLQVADEFDACSAVPPHGWLSDLLWDAAYVGSQGLLPASAHPYDVIELRDWPNLTRVMHDDDTVRICALMASSRATVAMVGGWLQVPNTQVFRVYAAAQAAGLITVKFSGSRLEAGRNTGESRAAQPRQIHEPASADGKRADSGVLSILSRIMARFRSL